QRVRRVLSRNRRRLNRVLHQAEEPCWWLQLLTRPLLLALSIGIAIALWFLVRHVIALPHGGVQYALGAVAFFGVCLATYLLLLGLFGTSQKVNETAAYVVCELLDGFLSGL